VHSACTDANPVEQCVAQFMWVPGLHHSRRRPPKITAEQAYQIIALARELPAECIADDPATATRWSPLEVMPQQLTTVKSILQLFRGCRLRSALLALVVMVNLAAGLAPALDPGFGALPTRCVSQVSLVAHAEQTLIPHHQWLETPPHFAGENLTIWRFASYILLNTRTGTGFGWNIEELDRESQQIRFGVLTRWVWLHPGWANDPWILLYDCPSP